MVRLMGVVLMPGTGSSGWSLLESLPVARCLGIFPGAELRLLSVSSWTSCQVPLPV